MKLKRGDKVIVIAGADKGKVGTIQKSFPKLNRVVVDGVNTVKKHKKSRSIRYNFMYLLVPMVGVEPT